MGQHSKWLPQQLSQSISNSSETISNNYNYASNNNNFNLSHIPNGYVNGIVEHTIHNNKTVLSSSSSPLLSASSNDGHETIDQFPKQIFQSFAQQQIHNFSETIAEKLSDALQLALISEQKLNGTTTSTPLTSNPNENNADIGDDISISSNYLMLLLIILYVIIVIGGVFGNASLIITLYTQSSARLRNPLLVALCLADLMVTGVSAPLTIVTLILMAQNAIRSTIVCKLIYFMQVPYYLPIHIIRRIAFFVYLFCFFFVALIFGSQLGCWLLVALNSFHLVMKAEFLEFRIPYSVYLLFKKDAIQTISHFVWIVSMAFQMEKWMPLIIIRSNISKYRYSTFMFEILNVDWCLLDVGVIYLWKYNEICI